MYAVLGIRIACVAYSDDLVEQLETRKFPRKHHCSIFSQILETIFYLFWDPSMINPWLLNGYCFKQVSRPIAGKILSHESAANQII